MSRTKNTQASSFEDTMGELETLVTEMEKGELPLEDALAKFERGIVLARNSQKMLKEAEQKVQMLMTQNGEETLVDLPGDDDQAQ